MRRKLRAAILAVAPALALCVDAAGRPAIGSAGIPAGAAIWSKRQDRYSEERVANTDADGKTPVRDRLEMYHIGG